MDFLYTNLHVHVYCTSFSVCYKTMNDKAIVGHDLNSIFRSDADECLAECVEETGFVCKSLERVGTQCWLQDVDSSDVSVSTVILTTFYEFC